MPRMPKRSASPSSSLASPTALHKNPIFGVLVGMSAFLVLTSLVMYSRLDTMASNDFDDLLLGSSQGDGMRNDAFDLRQSQGRHHKKRGHKKHRREENNHGGNGGGFMSMLDGPPSMADNIATFAEWKEHEAHRRKKRGMLNPREEFEQTHKNPYSQEKLKALRVPDFPSPPDVPYDIYNCPKHPPKGYPFAWNSLKLLGHWNPDDTDLPSGGTIHQSLCVFEWETDQAKALNYRTAQVPFVIRNSPDVNKASQRWTSEGYLDRLLGDEAIRNEHSHNNHFMYWKTRHPIPDFTPPTDMVDLTYTEWYERAKKMEQVSSKQQTEEQHWYFRLNAMLEKHGYVYDELPFFDPSLGETMTMIEPTEHRGINCRFGMKGVIAETHFDSSSNFIAILGGQRRYILAHPDQCINMELYPQSHPSGRHSSIDWSTANQEFDNGNVDRPFVHAQLNEVVMQAGDLLYLPTYWFHFIVSLNMNYQCNSRSGSSDDYEPFIADCGFKGPGARTKK